MTFKATPNLLYRSIAIMLAVFASSRSFGVITDIFSENTFVNRTIDIEHFEFFFEDHIGRVWGGSYANGPMLYNGETFARKIQGKLGHKGIRCCAHLGGNDYLIGCSAGLFRLDVRTLKYELINGFETDEVRAIDRLDDNTLLCFCNKRIVRLTYDTDESETPPIEAIPDSRSALQTRNAAGRATPR